MMFDALSRVRDRLAEIRAKVSPWDESFLALSDAIEELDDAMVMDVRAQTYVAESRLATFCEEMR
jgi:hypothetical protein